MATLYLASHIGSGDPQGVDDAVIWTDAGGPTGRDVLVGIPA